MASFRTPESVLVPDRYLNWKAPGDRPFPINPMSCHASSPLDPALSEGGGEIFAALVFARLLNVCWDASDRSIWMDPVRSSSVTRHPPKTDPHGELQSPHRGGREAERICSRQAAFSARQGRRPRQKWSVGSR